MNARQAAKYYKKKYKELENILSISKPQQNITYTNSKIIRLKRLLSIPIQEYCKDEFEYNYNLHHMKLNLMHAMQDDLSEYIQINRNKDYEDYISSKYKEDYIAEISILDERY